MLLSTSSPVWTPPENDSTPPLLRAILEQFEALYPHVGDPDLSLYKAWSARLAMVGEAIVVRTAEGDQAGVLAGATPDGALLLRQTDGQTLKVLAGDVRLRPARGFDSESISH